ncbi:MAG TPA: EAL domain-containing protein [Burkholderiaceae bacterium]|jgi:diguanylate cyclase (GGDEF)-like protein/PAS domain S-box-containing protein
MQATKARATFQNQVMASFMAAVLVVAGLAIGTWKLASDANAAEEWVTHTYEVIDHLARIQGATLQVEFSTQSYRLSGEIVHLNERDAVIEEREHLLAQLKALTADNPVQQQRWAELRRNLDARLATSNRIVQLRQDEGTQAANAFAAQAQLELQATRERTYKLLGEMDADERALLGARSSQQQGTRQRIVVLGGAIALMLLALLAMTYALIRRQLRVEEASRRAISEREASLNIMLHSIGDAVLATDTEGRITRMNRVAERLTGWAAEEALGRPVDEVFRIVHEQTREPAESPVMEVLATGRIQLLADHTALIARDGSECPIADSAAPIRDNADHISGVVLVFRDETVARLHQHMILEQQALLEQRVRERTAQLQESEEHLRSVIGTVPAMIAYVDADQRYVYANEQYRQGLAPDIPDISGMTVREVLDKKRYRRVAALIFNALQGLQQTYDWQPSPDVWQVIQFQPKRDEQGKVLGYYVLGTDITERKRAEERISGLNAELAQRVHELEHVSRAMRTLSSGNRALTRATAKQDLLDSMCKVIVNSGHYDMAVVWYRNEDDAKTLRAMAECGYPGGLPAMLGLTARWGETSAGRGVVGRAIHSGQSCVVDDLRLDPYMAPLREQLHGMTSAVACPLRVGGEIIGALIIYDAEPYAFDADTVLLLTELADDLAFGIEGFRARAEQQRVQDALHRLTRYDTLTGLPNETHFAEGLAETIATSALANRPFVLLQANVERLSEINDALGFSHGDQLLRDFGERLRKSVPESATVARLRGDEFAVLFPNTTAQAVPNLVRQLEMRLATPFSIADIELDVSARMGISTYPEHGTTPHDLFRHTDIAMQQAKREGAPHIIFNPRRYQNQSQRLAVAGELRRAIENGDLLLYLQPKVEMASGHVCGAEGLVRWNHPTRGLVPPNEFIGLAEHTGLIKPLTEWVLETAMRLSKEWESRSCSLPIAVNLSARNLRDDSLLAKIQLMLTGWDVQPGHLELEITESTLMEDAEFALRVLHSLREQGIPLYIDDFGTGYSSLSYLQKLPVGYIKIDQSFVKDMLVSKESLSIVRSTIDLVRDLGRKTVAEGVETQQDWDQLAALGCDIGQGYFIARPMPAEAFPAWVESFRPIVTSPAVFA